ncbi:Hypothetical protein HDN1F_34580 [gamma proteobacterium HdN1]|nr:Hypothetical protein HDN1F_34580 [gamma proteobacterium HdN1]
MKPSEPISPKKAALLGFAVLVGGAAVFQVASIAHHSIQESLAQAQADKQSERERKAMLLAEKKRAADEKRIKARVEAERVQAEKNSGYEFYDYLVAREWPVPVLTEVYSKPQPVAAIKAAPKPIAQEAPPVARPQTRDVPPREVSPVAKVAPAQAPVREIRPQASYSVVAAFSRSESEILTAQRRLGSLGYSARIDSVAASGGGKLYRLKVGPFDNRDKANQARSRLQANNYFAQVFSD